MQGYVLLSSSSQGVLQVLGRHMLATLSRRDNDHPA